MNVPAYSSFVFFLGAIGFFATMVLLVSTVVILWGISMRWVIVSHQSPQVDPGSHLPYRLSWEGVLYFLHEVGTAQILVYTYPFGFIFPWIARRLRREDERPLIVLAHGYQVNSACFLSMWWRFRKAGFHNLIVVNHPRKFGSIYHMAEALNRTIEGLRPAHGKVFIVGHSMGGIVARQYLHTFGDPGKVAGVVTLGSPHHGTVVASLGRGTCSRQMTPGSAYLRELDAEKDELKRFNFRSLYSRHDGMVLPPDSSVLFDDDTTREIPYIGHNSLLWDKRVFDDVLMMLEASIAASGTISAR